MFTARLHKTSLVGQEAEGWLTELQPKMQELLGFLEAAASDRVSLSVKKFAQ